MLDLQEQGWPVVWDDLWENVDIYLEQNPEKMIMGINRDKTFMVIWFWNSPHSSIWSPDGAQLLNPEASYFL